MIKIFTLKFAFITLMPHNYMSILDYLCTILILDNWPRSEILATYLLLSGKWNLTQEDWTTKSTFTEIALSAIFGAVRYLIFKVVNKNNKICNVNTISF